MKHTNTYESTLTHHTREAPTDTTAAKGPPVGMTSYRSVAWRGFGGCLFGKALREGNFLDFQGARLPRHEIEHNAQPWDGSVELYVCVCV